MVLFGKQFRPNVGGNTEERLSAVEAHLSYMQERLEFYANQNDKRLDAIKKESEVDERL